MDKLISAMQSRVNHIHFIGIGGVGMSGIAEVLINLGYQVSGSDLREGPTTDRLRQLGAKISIGHAQDHLIGADVVVTSTAIATENPELIAAKQKRIPIVPRAEMLAELMRFSYGIAIAGTHGKTTTTSLVAALLCEGQLDPTFVIGGKLNSTDSNAQLGSGRYLVAEADESDASFLYLQPVIAVVTNIDADHMATYQGDFNKLKDTFLAFLHHLPFYGLAVLCIDDPVIKSLLPQVTRPVLTYGFSAEADYQISALTQSEGKSTFKVTNHHSGQSADIDLSMPGHHNALNATAALVVARNLEVTLSACQRALNDFSGIARRFSLLGNLDTKAGSTLLVDDYGHHPTELAATIAATRSSWPEKRVVVLFQPHRYSRTQDLFDDFVSVLSTVDVLLMLPVYAAGEQPISGADSKCLCRAVRARGQIDPIFIEDQSVLLTILNEVLLDGDVLLTMGAGDIGTMVQQIYQSLGRGQ